ncbi:class II aldolase/adducin family protein [Agromyces atrinae]|uniref:class II aldolase/adducin family protein n=1 Tax=Agromyces atrinae TaxID=592376 RepID=UPI001F5A38F5|nr:class II aldolase/adducin family protein [Agromyces atrinae]MCI2957512.1 class II aldolase/adducin family protein [Agromyces atrinae]
MSTFSARVEVAIARIRADVAHVHAELPRHGLVSWTDGSVSARVPGADLFVIKPSGVAYAELAPENMVLCTLDAGIVDGTPGGDGSLPIDVAMHAAIYRHVPEAGAVAHTHSPYATAWATRAEAIPCATTAMAREFGGPVPVVTASPVDAESLGRAVAATLAEQRSRVVLVPNTGPFAIGTDARDAVRLVVLTEDVARTVQLARQDGALSTLDQSVIDALFDGAHGAARGDEPRLLAHAAGSGSGQVGRARTPRNPQPNTAPQGPTGP